MCKPYNGDPADFERFMSDLEIRLSRENLPRAKASVEYSLADTLLGEDAFGIISQENPDTFIGALDDPALSDSERRERSFEWADHTKRDSLVYSYFLSLITDVNLSNMIKDTRTSSGYRYGFEIC